MWIFASWSASGKPDLWQYCDRAAAYVLAHVQLFATPWTVAHQAPLSTGFSKQEYWSGLPCPPPGELPNPGIKLLSPGSPALVGIFFFLPLNCIYGSKNWLLLPYHWSKWAFNRKLWDLYSWLNRWIDTKATTTWDFPGGPVVKTHLPVQGAGSIPG